MAKPVRPIDFGQCGLCCQDEAFAFSSGPTPSPTDLVSENVWSGIMHLPDDVAIRTSDHHGTQLATLHLLWDDWLEAMGDQHDELFAGMLDATLLSEASLPTHTPGRMLVMARCGEATARSTTPRLFTWFSSCRCRPMPPLTSWRWSAGESSSYPNLQNFSSRAPNCFGVMTSLPATHALCALRQ
jgi:hypothetical protein